VKKSTPAPLLSWNLIKAPAGVHSYTLAPVRHSSLLRSFTSARVAGRFIVRLKFFSKWELSTGLDFKSNVVYQGFSTCGPLKNFWRATALYYWNWICFARWTFNRKRGAAWWFATHNVEFV